MLASLGILAVLATQPAAAERSPYLDAVRRYGSGTEAEAVRAVVALHIERPERVFDELDQGFCRAVQARSCHPADLARLDPASRARLFALWQALYPRALAVHLEVLGGLHPGRDAAALAAHRAVIVRVIVRIEQIAAHADVPDDFARFAIAGRRLLVWAQQYLRDEAGLATTLEAFAAAIPQDVELRLARAALAELRTEPGAVAASERVRLAATERSASLKGGYDAVAAGERTRGTPAPPGAFEKETRRRVEIAAAAYEQAIDAGADVAEAHLRLARNLLVLDRLDAAERHLARALELPADPRQVYLARLFLADLRERQQRLADAMAAYVSALAAWPGAQAPVVALARLRALSGATEAARTTLTRIHVERDMRERSDPWMGYVGGQGWRVPAALAALRRDFEAQP